jgi:hypothetical protein
MRVNLAQQLQLADGPYLMSFLPIYVQQQQKHPEQVLR